jgi:hypothetical protein
MSFRLTLLVKVQLETRWHARLPSKQNYPSVSMGCTNLGKPLEASLGGNSGGKSIPKTTQNDKLQELRVRLLRARNAREKFGGGEWSRTTDAADMSRVL